VSSGEEKLECCYIPSISWARRQGSDLDTGSESGAAGFGEDPPVASGVRFLHTKNTTAQLQGPCQLPRFGGFGFLWGGYSGISLV